MSQIYFKEKYYIREVNRNLCYKTNVGTYTVYDSYFYCENVTLPTQQFRYTISALTSCVLFIFYPLNTFLFHTLVLYNDYLLFLLFVYY